MRTIIFKFSHICINVAIFYEEKGKSHIDQQRIIGSNNRLHIAHRICYWVTVTGIKVKTVVSDKNFCLCRNYCVPAAENVFRFTLFAKGFNYIEKGIASQYLVFGSKKLP